MEDENIVRGWYRRSDYSGWILQKDSVAGRQLENDTIAFGLFRGMLTWGYADSRVARYPKGRVVSVFYDPQKPEVACLEQGGLGWEDVFMFIVSVAGVLFGLKELRKVIRRLAGSADARETSVHSVPILPSTPRSP